MHTQNHGHDTTNGNTQICQIFDLPNAVSKQKLERRTRKLTFECLMNGLSSLGVYLSNWKTLKRRKELVKKTSLNDQFLNITFHYFTLSLTQNKNT